MMTSEIVDLNKNIESYIYTIRGQQVILDSDLAFLYGVETKNLNKAMKRNIERFPERYCFKLTKEDLDSVRFQIGTSREMTLFKGQGGGSRYLPFAYTEQGVSMLSAVLRSKTAIEMSIKIIDSFVSMRQFIQNNNYLLDRVINNEVKLLDYQKDINELKQDTNIKFNQIFDYISEHKEVKEKIFYNGQIFEADNILIEIIKMANKEIILIDNYIDNKTLELLSYKNKDVFITIYTSKKGNYLRKTIIDDFNNEYKYLKIINNDIFHDRYLLLDKKEIYLIGASLKDAGSKCFSLIKLDRDNINRLLNKLNY